MPAAKNDGITRIERAALARKAQNAGLSIGDIAKALGVSRSYASTLLADPDGSKEKARKERYRGICIDCGGKTTYGKKGKHPFRCSACAQHHYPDARRKWTRERILADIQEWNRLYGSPPTAQDWLTGPSTKERDEKRGGRRWPHIGVVQKMFGSWSNALEVAGFERRVGYERTDEWKAKVTKWPKERIIERMQEWAAEHDGYAPAELEWKHKGPRHPASGTVRKHFGSWPDAVRQAGLRPPRPRRVRSSREPSEWEAQVIVARANGSKADIEVPTFESRGEGRSLLDVVEDLKGR